MADVILCEDEPKQEESTTASVKSEPDETSQETPNGDKTEAENDEAGDEKHDGKDRSTGNRRGNRFHPYKDKQDRKAGQRNRVFISNIPYDMKWQAIKDLMREKVGEVTYVELFKDAEGKSRGCGVVEFKDEEFVKKALEAMNKYDLSGRPLNILSDPDGEVARRVLQRLSRAPMGGRPDMGPGVMNIPPSIANNPNIPPEVIHALRTGRLGTTVFVANLDFKVGWKKLKEVFSMAGVVKRADVKEEKDGRSRGMGIVIYEQPLEAVQAISMFNGQMLFDRQMIVKMDDKSIQLDDFQMDKGPQLPRGLAGVGMGLGPGGQPINANRLSGGGDMGSMRPGGMDMPGYGGMNQLGGGMGGGGGGFGSMGSMGGFGRDMAPGRMGDMYRSGMGGMDRDFGRSDMSMNRGFGDSFGGLGGGGFGGGMGSGGMGMGSRLGSGMGSMGMDRMGSSFDRMGMSGGMDMNRSFGGYGGGSSGHMSGGMSNRGSGAKQGCQIFVRNLSFDLTWQKLKEQFSHCGQVMYAEIKMENGKSKGCGTVRFDCPESAEKACLMMNGTKINGREVDVRIDRTT